MCACESTIPRGIPQAAQGSKLFVYFAWRLQKDRCVPNDRRLHAELRSMKIARLALRAMAAASMLTGLAVSTSPAQQQRRGGPIRVQTNLVDILASVIDARGQPIPDLTQDAFQITEEGIPQKIERFEAETNRPLDLALMVDSSMSALKELKLETEAAAHFIRQVVRPGDTLAVFEFSEYVSLLSDFSNRRPQASGGSPPDCSGHGHFNL